jgi:hypothetical protein
MPTSFWRVGSPQPDPSHRLAPYDGIPTPYGERGMVVEAPGPFLQRQSVLVEKTESRREPEQSRRRTGNRAARRAGGVGATSARFRDIDKRTPRLPRPGRCAVWLAQPRWWRS